MGVMVTARFYAPTDEDADDIEASLSMLAENDGYALIQTGRAEPDADDLALADEVGAIGG
jgi:hypothetical protein